MGAIVITLIILAALVLISGWRLNKVEAHNDDLDDFLEEITGVINQLIDERNAREKQ